MKWLLILGIFLVVVGLVALRFRRQIQMALQVWRMFRTLKASAKTSSNGEVSKSEIKKAEDSPLVRCAKCSKWVPENIAINFRKKTFYCSANCIEVSVKTQ
jgi:Sec-independent protein translocase protein TatA